MHQLVNTLSLQNPLEGRALFYQFVKAEQPINPRKQPPVSFKYTFGQLTNCTPECSNRDVVEYLHIKKNKIKKQDYELGHLFKSPYLCPSNTPRFSATNPVHICTFFLTSALPLLPHPNKLRSIHRTKGTFSYYALPTHPPSTHHAMMHDTAPPPLSIPTPRHHIPNPGRM